MTVIISDTRVRDLVAARLESVANETCQEDFSLQEHQLTSRIAKTLEQELRRRSVQGYKVRVVTHDVPDKGRKSLEKPLGADLYIGFELIGGGARRSKGILVQAKKKKLMPPSQVKGLQGQCRSMISKTEYAYVWTYSKDGILSQEAAAVAQNGLVAPGRNIGKLFSDIFACKKGDSALGLPPSSDVASTRKLLGNMLKELSVSTGVAVLVAGPE